MPFKNALKLSDNNNEVLEVLFDTPFGEVFPINNDATDWGFESFDEDEFIRNTE